MLCECCYNVLDGQIPINSEQKHQLKPYRHSLRKLVDKSSLKTKKKILIQQGGFLQILMPALISGIASIIGSAIEKTA